MYGQAQRDAEDAEDREIEEAIQVDPDLLESRLRIARMMANGPLTDEPGA